MAVFKSCPSDLVYDETSSSCLEPEFVTNCPGGVATTPGEAPDIVTQPPPFGMCNDVGRMGVKPNGFKTWI